MNKKLIVITGASSGFGLEMAKLFDESGYSLLLLARTVDAIKSMPWKSALIEQVDVTDYDAFKQAVAKAEVQFGPTDLMINNAGVMLLGSIDNQDSSEWQSMVDINVIGVLNGMQIVLPQMRARKSGTIINVSSIAGFKTFLNHAAYCGTKYAVHAMSETVREEVSQDNVRVSIIAPGAAATNLLSHTTSEDIKAGYSEWTKTMDGGSLDPKHIATLAKFIYEMPQEVCIREIDIAKTMQAQ